MNVDLPVTASTSSALSDPAKASTGSYFILFPDSGSTYPLNTTTPICFNALRSNVPSG